MRGRAHQILRDFQARFPGARGYFATSRLILLAHVVPSQITPDLDDPAIEKRLEEAIAEMMNTAEEPPKL